MDLICNILIKTTTALNNTLKEENKLVSYTAFK